MFAVSLILSGIAFFLNGFLPLIDDNDNHETSVINTIAGIIVTVLGFYGLITASATFDYLLYGTAILFGITNLYVAAIGIWDLSETSFGWFSAVIALIMLAIGVYVIITGSLMFGIFALVWMFMWAFYFISRGLNVLKTPSSWVIMFIGIAAMVAEGVLLLNGIVTF